MSGYMTCVDCGESLTNELHDRCDRCEEDLREDIEAEEDEAWYQEVVSGENR